MVLEVVVEVLEGMTGTNATMFQWLAIQQINLWKFGPGLVQGWLVWVKVVLVDVVEVEVEVEAVEAPLWHPPWASNGPIIAIAMRFTGVDPVLATMTERVVTEPETERLSRLALRLPLTCDSELVSSFDS